ncbi:capsid cement protein [Euzebya sp.]|uniref:capsid cement protein n=1 Tax=Euzebya sp. TaxID=1971409 RepID=UPI003515B206
MSDHLPKYSAGSVTRTASAAITGGQLVTVTGDLTVGPAGAGDVVVGVADRDAATDELVTVTTIGVTHVLTAAAAVDAGDLLMAAADGEVTPVAAAAATGSATAQTATDIENAKVVIGVAWQDIAQDETGECLLRV